ncbi:hypothetical protein PCANC_03125 [Puccinia coronata f. sp. avenae]|uniref:Secreted protein n=1 Tax=Puccinia coronata f. sp. avenae TaxID=200324 RepID=A0A2N5W4M0_9BASI|nr:hypothetical protein PCANC_03125 [Puccinia coronata f. sp. avenae]
MAERGSIPDSVMFRFTTQLILLCAMLRSLVSAVPFTPDGEPRIISGPRNPIASIRRPQGCIRPPLDIDMDGVNTRSATGAIRSSAN